MKNIKNILPFPTIYNNDHPLVFDSDRITLSN